MKIAYVSADCGVPVFGCKGCSNHVQEIMRAFTRRGCDISLLAAHQGGICPADFQAVPCYKLPRLSGNEHVTFPDTQTLNRETVGTLQAQGPFDLIYERYSLWSYSAMEYARYEGIPAFLEVNAPLIEEQATFRGLLDPPGAQQAARRAFRAASRVIVVSEELVDYVSSYGVKSDCIEVVPNGVNTERFGGDVLPTLPSAWDTFTIGFVGSVRPWHGLKNLLSAVEALQGQKRRCRLLIVGSGVDVQDMPSGIDRNSVYITGPIPPGQVPGYMASMDVGVAPYTHTDHFYFSPLKIYEYMAAGLPVVASRIGQISAIVQDEITGILCQPDDHAELVKALVRLQDDPALRKRLRHAARRTILEGHTWSDVAGHILGLLGTLDENKARTEAVL